jgi:hypothetical protein
MRKTFWIKIIIIALLLCGSITVFAEEAKTGYTLLEPGVFNEEKGFAIGSDAKGFNDYAGMIFKAVLSIAIALAILRIVLGGFTYVTSSTFGGKGGGKEMITQAIIGLVILLLSWLALYTINPDLVVWKLKIDNLGETKNQETSPKP